MAGDGRRVNQAHFPSSAQDVSDLGHREIKRSGRRYTWDAEGMCSPFPMTSRVAFHTVSAAEHQLRSARFLIGISLCQANDDLGEASKRVIRRFQKPHRHIKRDSAASAKSKSLTTLHNVKAVRAADFGNDAEAALRGLAP